MEMLFFSTFTFGLIGESMARFQLLLFVGYFAAAQAGSGFDCINDSERIFCQLAVKQCSEYTVDVQNNSGHGKTNCSLVQCDEQCCCSVDISMFIPGETYTAEAFKGTEKVASLTFDLLATLKPKTPVIVSVNETEGVFTVKWRTNMEHFLDRLTAEIAISKKEGTKPVFKPINPSIVNGLQTYEISGQDLDQDTAYVVSVRSYTDWSGKFSEPSKEFEFKTPASDYPLLLVIIIGFCVIGIILFVGAYTCFVRTKRKYWDSFSQPKLLIVPSMEQKVLKPCPIDTSNVNVMTPPPSDEDQMLKQRGDVHVNRNSSGINTGSSGLCYGQTEPPDHKTIIQDAICKALAGHVPQQFGMPVPQDETVHSLIENETSSGSSGITNRIYFMPIEHDSTVKLLDNSSYSCKSKTVNCSEQQLPAFLFSALKNNSSPVCVDMSYQPCKVDPKRSSYAETPSLSSTSSDTSTDSPCGFESTVEADFESSSEVSADPVKLLFSFKSCEPLRSDRCTVVVDGYKPFPTKVDQPDFLMSEQQSSDRLQCVTVNPEEQVSKVSPKCTIPGLDKWINPCTSAPQTPHFSLVCTERSIPVMISSDYKCV